MRRLREKPALLLATLVVGSPISAAGCSVILDSAPKDARDDSGDLSTEDPASDEPAADIEALETDTRDSDGREPDAAQDDELTPHDGEEEAQVCPTPADPEVECSVRGSIEACDVFYPGCPTAGSRTCLENCTWSSCELPSGTVEICDDLLDNDCDSSVNEECPSARVFLDFGVNPPFCRNQVLSDIITGHAEGLICLAITVTDPGGATQRYETIDNNPCGSRTCWTWPSIPLGSASGVYRFVFIHKIGCGACDCADETLLETRLLVEDGVECP